MAAQSQQEALKEPHLPGASQLGASCTGALARLVASSSVSAAFTLIIGEYIFVAVQCRVTLVTPFGYGVSARDLA